MKYLRYFDSSTAAMNAGNLKSPQVSIIENSVYCFECGINEDVKFSLKNGKMILNYSNPKLEVGDILYNNFTVNTKGELTSLGDTSAIGVCIIEDNFITNDNMARFMALDEYYAPKWSNSDDSVTDLSNQIMVPYVGNIVDDGQTWTPSNTVNNVISLQTTTYICAEINDITTIANPYDPKTSWCYHSYYHLPSPYIKKGDKYVFNEGVFNISKLGNTVINNAFNDLNGLANTMAIHNYYPLEDEIAANKCLQYSKGKINKGNWYLPAIGELAFLPVRFETINNAIKNANGTEMNPTAWFWSSSQFAKEYALNINLSDCHYSTLRKHSNAMVRPFFQIEVAKTFKK